MTKEDLLQDWLPRLWDALNDVKNKQNAAAEETIYELYVEMRQQTLAEKIETFSELTLEDQLSAAMIELRKTQRRVAMLEDGIEPEEDDEDQICSWCNGCGEGVYDGAACGKCKGTGVEPVEKDEDL